MWSFITKWFLRNLFLCYCSHFQLCRKISTKKCFTGELWTLNFTFVPQILKRETHFLKLFILTNMKNLKWVSSSFKSLMAGVYFVGITETKTMSNKSTNETAEESLKAHQCIIVVYIFSMKICCCFLKCKYWWM